MIRIVIAEDQTLLREALSAVIQLESDFSLTGTAADGEAARRLIERDPPDLVITDIEMPRLSGLDLAASIKSGPAATRVLIVTTFDRPGYLRRAMEIGVDGYLLKDTPSAELAAAIRLIVAGERVIAPELASLAWDSEDPLTETERRLLRLAEEGLDSPAIAERSGLARGTVRNYLHAAMGKLGVSNRVAAVRLAREKGWL